jgi:MscS family membrane protein
MYHTVKQDVLFRIADIIATHQAEFAYPTRSLHIESSTIQDTRQKAEM